MRLLPRSRRGTWLLAGAVWLVACAILWWALPPRPLATLELPVDTFLLGFGPQARTALVLRNVSTLDVPSPVRTTSAWAVDIVEVPTGRLVTTLVDRCKSVKVLGVSIDGQTWLLKVDLIDAVHFKIDLSRNVAEELSPELVEIAENWLPALSPDGRLCVFSDPLGAKGTILWDVVDNQRKAVLPDVHLPFAFAPDGLSLAAQVFKKRNCIRVFDLATFAPLATFTGPFGSVAKNICLSDDGSNLVGEFFTRGDSRAENRTDTMIWHIASGQAQCLEGHEQPTIAADTRSVLALDLSENNLIRYDISARSPLTSHSTYRGAWELSPDRRFVVVASAEFELDLLERIRKFLGLNLSFGKSGDRVCARLVSTESGQSLLKTYPMGWFTSCGGLEGQFAGCRWSAGGTQLALIDEHRDNVWHLWKIPPRKPLSRFAAGTTLLALSFAWLARRRVRKLQAVAA